MKKISAPQTQNVEAAIRDVFEAGCAAWNRGDLDGYLAGYWDSEETLWISSGSLLRGRKAIVAAYQDRFSEPQQMGVLSLTELDIDVLTPTDAIASGRWSLDLEDRSSKGFFTVQLKKIEGIWFYVCDHSSASS